MGGTAARVLASARRLGARVAVAESLTGGLLAAAIVSVPGASLVFSGGVVAYDTRLKHSLLDVDAALLAERGPVDPEVARQMARGARVACGVPPHPGSEVRPADFGIATTGVAGPDPDPRTGTPPGTVWLGVSGPRGERALELRLSGDRAEIRALTVLAALQELAIEMGDAADRR
ncbi:CinA family protein [Leucobacter sp. CSA1]|uniref:CinA family protein n=1 Tax=Leucobacter chromiisoli TaxID=2796471 RepID=A0A934Q7W3_9MICO|nr:CinA family protein [Leucobacter chromiisoli]